MKKLFLRITTSSLVRTSFLNALANFVKILTSLVTSKITAVYLGPPGMALLGQFSNITSMAMSLATLGINSGVTKSTAEYGDEPKKREAVLSSGFIVTLTGSIVVSLSVFLGRDYLSFKFLHTHEYAIVFVVLAVTVIFFAFNGFLMSVLNGYKEFKILALINIVGSLLGLLIVIFLVVFYGILGAFLGVILSQTLIFFVTLFFVLKTKWFSLKSFLLGPQWESIRKLSHFSLMAVTSIFAITFIQLQIRNYIIHTLSVEEAGYWQGIMRVSDMYLSFITMTLSVYYLPRLAELKTNIEIRKEILKGYTFILPMAIISALAIYLLREWIVRILLAKTFLPMVDLFLMQLIGDVFKIAAWLLGYLLIAKSMTKTFIITECLFGLSLYALSVFFISKMGVIGATYAFAFNYIIYFFVMVFIFRNTFLLRAVKV